MANESTDQTPTCHPTGKWIVAANGSAFCSVCGRGLNAPLPEVSPAKTTAEVFKTASEVAEDVVNHPAHYTKGKIETIDVLEDIVQYYPDPVSGSLAWQVIKYLSRAPHKGAFAVDIQKAGWYFDRLRKRLGS